MFIINYFIYFCEQKVIRSVQIKISKHIKNINGKELIFGSKNYQFVLK